MLGYLPPISVPALTGGYISIGNLHRIQSLRVRRVGPRFTGMSIYHDDGSVDVLGQWDFSQSSTISEIYSWSNGVLTSIAFSFSGEVDTSYVDRVLVGVNHMDPLENMHSSQELIVFSTSELNPVRYCRNVAGRIGLTYT